MLAMSVFFALRDALAACGSGRRSPKLRAPATPEAVLAALDSLVSSHATAEAAVEELP
jgi:xanthine dehydrogenase large subunit